MSNKLSEQQQISTTSPIAIVINPTGKTTQVMMVRFFNISTTESVLVKLFRVPDASGSLGTPTASHQFDQIVIPPEEARYLREFIVLEDHNEAIFAQASIASVINTSSDGFIK